MEETVWLNDLPVAILTGSGTGAAAYYVHPDHLGAPKVINDGSGNTVWAWGHDPFGNGQPSGTFTYNLRYPGQYYDSESGLNYNMNRDYDPVIGRYIQSDPIGLKGGINTYGYVNQNPMWATDPEGLLSWLERHTLKNARPDIIRRAKRVIDRMCGGSLTEPQQDDLLEEILENINREDAEKFSQVNPNSTPLALNPGQDKIVQDQLNQISNSEIRGAAVESYNAGKLTGSIVVK